VSQNLPLVLELFAPLFGSRWLARWHQQWQQQHPAPPPASCRGRPKPAQGTQGSPAQKPSPPGRFYQRIFSLRVTLWYLIFQRLSADPTMGAVVVDLRHGGADRLGRKGRKLSRRVRSTGTSGYNQARQRLPLELLSAALVHLRQALLELVGLVAQPRKEPGPEQRTRQLLDGSTLAVLVTPRLATAYPPARNQSGPSDWCLLRIVVGFCARSGAVLSAVEGAMQQSEQALAWTVMAAGAAFTIWIGDRNFGVWSVVAKALSCQQDALVRLTGARAAKLCQGRPLRSGQERWVQWPPSSRDQAPPGTERLTVSGRLIYVRLRRGAKWIDLWLFTTLDAQDYPLELLVQWYGQRWQAEVHFRSVKTHLRMAELHVCSPEMARKEFYAGLLAYSLVRAVMWQAGQRWEAGLVVLSFSQARRVLVQHLKQWGQQLGAGAPWSRALLAEVAQHRLPKRRQPRPTEIRRVRHRRLRFPPLRGSRAAARARDLKTKSA